MKNPALPACAAALLFCCGLAGAVQPARPDSRPNIVVILADDVGYSDIGCFGGEIRTPRLDALAAGGLRFTQFYNTARCCPTRASLLTGVYPHQAAVGHMMEDRGHPGYRGNLSRRTATLAETLRPAGYGAYAVGKWHVTPNRPNAEEPDRSNWPLQRGFDRFYGTIHGAGSFYDPNSLVRDNRLISPFADPEYRPERYFYTDAISDQAVRFLSEHHRRDAARPSLLYVAYTAAHWPMHAPEEDIARQKGRYSGGYAAVREARLERLRRLGLLAPGWTPAPAVGDWSTVPNREWEERCMEVYAAMLERMDVGIGRIVDELRREGRLDNTLVFYMQDNGGCAEVLGRQAPANAAHTRRPAQPPFPPMPAEALQRDMIPKQTRDGYPVLQGPGVMPGGPDSFIAYGKNWASVSNTPFREYKHWVHEGGISTPLIAHWPAGIAPGLRGQLVRDPGHLIDIMATCVDVSEARHPPQLGAERMRRLEGASLAPAFRGSPILRSQPLFWEHEGNRAIRDGRWKLVAKENQPWELYDMETDRTESRNLAASQPDRVRELASKWQSWAARAEVLPLGTWRASR